MLGAGSSTMRRAKVGTFVKRERNQNIETEGETKTK
jgi:hypothetical protein